MSIFVKLNGMALAALRNPRKSRKSGWWSLLQKGFIYYKDNSLCDTLHRAWRVVFKGFNKHEALQGWGDCPSDRHKTESFQFVKKSLFKRGHFLFENSMGEIELNSLCDKSIRLIQARNSLRENLIFYRYLRLYCNLYDAWRFRSNLRSHLVENLKNNRHVSIHNIQMAIEHGEYDLCNWWLDKNVTKSDRRYINVRFFLSLLSSDDLGVEVFSDRINSRPAADERFSAELKDKKIAVIGPIDISNLADLTNFDFYATPKFVLGSSTLRRPGKIISYYGAGAINHNCVGVTETASHVAYSCFKKQSLIDRISKPHMEEGRLRVMRKPDDVMFNDYGASALQNIIYDILLCRPNGIKIYNTNFYLGKQRRCAQYLQGMNMEAAARQDIGMRVHDPFPNFIFVRNLFQNNIIAADEAVTGVLELSEEGYAESLGRQYGQI